MSHARHRPVKPRLPAWPFTLLATLALLWLVYASHAAGRPLWALGLLVLGGSAVAVYSSARSLAWRYLYPGVVGMLVFVAFPLLYTVQIGFTNYSSSHLLAQDRARSYLLDQATVDDKAVLAFSLHAQDGRWRLVLSPADGGPLWSAPLALDPGAPAQSVPMSALPADAALAPALDLRDRLAHRSALMATTLALPDGRMLHYAGVREFAPRQPLWTAEPAGALRRAADSALFSPNPDTGFFESARGERLQPGFTVGVGWANYARLFGDADVRGPFGAIFVWTVVFAALTVLFSTALGMALAVLLNWEALRGRTLYRTLLFLPYAVPGFISILVFKGLFNQNFGEINAILDALFGVRPAWFADPLLAKAMLLIVNTWLGFPYFMLLCSGLIKAIPADLYEASAMAGAGPWTNFRRITAPLILRPLTPLLVSAFAFNFNNFVLISLLTDGRPDFLNTKLPAGTTDILVSYTYRIAFTDAGQNFGLAAAISTVIFALVAVLSLINLRLTRASVGGTASKG